MKNPKATSWLCQSVAHVLLKLYRDSAFKEARLSQTAISFKQGCYLRDLCLAEKPNRIIELGVHYGFASLWLYLGGKRVLKQMDCVDPWLPDKHNIAASLLMKDPRIKYITNQSSQEYLAGLLKSKKRLIDLICIDADEKFDGVTTDLYFAIQLVKVGGVITIRNVWNPSVRRALLFYLKNFPLEILGISRFQMWLLRVVPFFSDWLLRHLVGSIDFCTMRLTAEDTRSWDHYQSFFIVSSLPYLIPDYENYTFLFEATV